MSQSIQHAIVLAGGFGTRLKEVVQDVPKPMAPVAQRPFLEYQLDYLAEQGIREVTLCTGHLSYVIEEHFGNNYQGITIHYSIEKEPLGTGGAIKKAFVDIKEDHVVVLNGDSFFGIDLKKFYSAAIKNENTICLALKKLKNFNRYGSVIFDQNFEINSFQEKKAMPSGWINGGIYLLKKEILSEFPYEARFSFENFLTEYVSRNSIRAFLSDGYFIDIGIPEDYKKAHKELPMVTTSQWQGWTIFLDRDGVINERTPGDYVRSMEGWKYCAQSLEAIKILSKKFDRIVVVTNQQGVGLKLMSAYQLSLIHQFLKDDVFDKGGFIDKIYASTDLKEKENNTRKPNPGMAIMAKNDFPDIDFKHCIMIGDSGSDIKFGSSLGMKTIAIRGKEEDYPEIKVLNPDWVFDNLFAAARFLETHNPKNTSH